jgi:RNA polymerase sigma-70 factor, ECF subfamily
MVTKEFKVFFHTYYEPLYNYAYVVLQSEVEAEDVVQELFTDLWEKGNLAKIEFPDRYLLRAVKFKCINIIQRVRVKEASLFSEIQDVEIATEESFGMREEDILPMLHYYAAKLPPKTREIFLLSREEGLRYKEIAEVKGISIKTVETQMGRALKILRKLLIDNPILFIILSSRF